MSKNAKEILLKVLDVIEREASGEAVHICEELSSKEVKNILKKEFDWKEPSYGKLTKDEIFEAADEFVYGDDYDSLYECGLTKENKENALKFLLSYCEVNEVSKDAEKEYLKWIKNELVLLHLGKDDLPKV